MIAKSAPARTFPTKCSISLSQSGDRGCRSGNAATPTQKSPSTLDQPDQLLGVRQPVGVLDPLGLRIPRRIAAQREHVADPGGGEAADDAAQLGDRVVDGRQVADRRERGVDGDPLGDAEGAVAGRTRRRRRSPTRRSAAAARAARIACHSVASPASVLGGKNSKEYDGSARRDQLD